MAWHNHLFSSNPSKKKKKKPEEHFSEGINDPAGGFNKNACFKVSRTFKTSVYQLCLQISFSLKDIFNKKNCKCRSVCLHLKEKNKEVNRAVKLAPVLPVVFVCDCNIAVQQIWLFELDCPAKRLPAARKQTQDLHIHSQTMINAFDMPSLVLLALKFRTRSVCIHARNTKVDPRSELLWWHKI